MEINISKEDDIVVVKIIGRLDTINAVDFSKELAPYYSEKNVKMQIDCEEMDYIASSGLRVYMSTYKALTANGGELKVVNVQPKVKYVFELTGFTSFLNLD